MSKFTRDTCACGCGRERRPGSKYYSDKCCQHVAALKKYARRAAGIAPVERDPEHTVRREPARHPSVTILDPMVALPYYISKAEFDIYRRDYPPGTVAIIHGERMVL